MQMPPLNHCGIVHHLHHLIGIWVVWIKQPTLGQDTSLNSLFIQRLWASRTINYNILTNYLRLIWGCCAVPCSVFRDVLWNRRCLFCFSFCIFLKASVSFVVFFLEDHCWSFFFLPIETWTMVYTSGDFCCFTVTPGRSYLFLGRAATLVNFLSSYKNLSCCALVLQVLCIYCSLFHLCASL